MNNNNYPRIITSTLNNRVNCTVHVAAGCHCSLCSELALARASYLCGAEFNISINFNDMCILINIQIMAY